MAETAGRVTVTPEKAMPVLPAEIAVEEGPTRIQGARLAEAGPARAAMAMAAKVKLATRAGVGAREMAPTEAAAMAMALTGIAVVEPVVAVAMAKGALAKGAMAKGAMVRETGTGTGKETGMAMPAAARVKAGVAAMPMGTAAMPKAVAALLAKETATLAVDNPKATVRAADPGTPLEQRMVVTVRLRQHALRQASSRAP
jgi:hypothetical protein